MANLAKRKEDTKKAIRSLLLSAPNGLSLQELLSDYSMFIGGRLPSKELGYASVEEFVKDIPDTVEVTQRNGTYMLKAVSDASTEHIQRLVSNQKISSRRNRSGNSSTSKRRPGPFNRYTSSRGWSDAPFRSQDREDGLFSSGSGQRRNLQTHAKHRNIPSVPAYVRGKIQEIIEKYPDGLSLTDVPAVYSKHCGVALDNLGMGYSSVYDLLASLMDIVALKQRSAGETWVMSVKPSMPGSKTLNSQKESIVDKQTATRAGHENSRLHMKTDVRPAVSETTRGHTSEGSMSQSNVNKFTEMDVTCNIPVVVQDQIKQIMSSRPNGVYASRLHNLYKETYKKDLPYRTYGYNSVIEFVSDLQHIIRVVRNHPEGDWHLFPVSGQSSVEDSSKCTPQKQKTDKGVDIQVDKFTKETIYQVLSMHCDGIPLVNFQATYKKMTGHVLDFASHGAEYLKQLLHSLPDLLFISCDSSDRPIVHLKVPGGPRRFDKLQDHYHPVAALEQQARRSAVNLPHDAVGPGCCYRPQELPTFEASNEQFLDLYVSNVSSPSTFWIQLRGDKTTLALEDVMDELEEVYTCKRLPAEYSMSSVLAKPGMVCAALYPQDGQWHRGLIIGFKDHLFEVYYVDYGNNCLVSISQMRLLKKKFFKLPAQAIQARLSNIKPRHGVWRADSKCRLLALCGGNPLVGMVTNIQDRVVSLCLVDTNQEEDIHINDVLVREGYAILASDEDNPQSTCQLQVPSLELLYGENTSTDKQGSTSSGVIMSHRYVRQAQVTDNLVMNLINLNGQLYIMSSEVSALFFKDDIISAQLYKDNTDVPKVVVTRKEHPDLFNELAVYGPKNYRDNTAALSLYPVSLLPLMIELYGKIGDFEELKGTVLEILQWFDPEDPYWKGQTDDDYDYDDDDNSSSCTDDVEEVKPQSSVGDNLSVENLNNLQLVLNCLQIKRKRLLNQMLSGDHCTPQSVNELNDLELQLKRVGNMIAHIDKPTSAQVPGGCSAQVDASAAQETNATRDETCKPLWLPKSIPVQSVQTNRSRTASSSETVPGVKVDSSNRSLTASPATTVSGAQPEIMSSNGSAGIVTLTRLQPVSSNDSLGTQHVAPDGSAPIPSSHQKAPSVASQGSVSNMPANPLPSHLGATAPGPHPLPSHLSATAPGPHPLPSHLSATAPGSHPLSSLANATTPSTHQESQEDPAMKALIQHQIQLNNLLLNHLKISQTLPVSSFGRGAFGQLTGRQLSATQQMIQPLLAAMTTQEPLHPFSAAMTTQQVTQPAGIAQLAAQPGPTTMMSQNNVQQNVTTCQPTPTDMTTLDTTGAVGSDGQAARAAVSSMKGIGRGLPLGIILDQQQKYMDLLTQSQLTQSLLLQGSSSALANSQPGNLQTLPRAQPLQDLNHLNLRPAFRNIRPSAPQSLSNSEAADPQSLTSSGCCVPGGEQASLGRLGPVTALTTAPNTACLQSVGFVDSTCQGITGQNLGGLADSTYPSIIGGLAPNISSQAAGMPFPTFPTITGQKANLRQLVPNSAPSSLPNGINSQQAPPSFSLLSTCSGNMSSGAQASQQAPPLPSGCLGAYSNSSLLQAAIMQQLNRNMEQIDLKSSLAFLGRGRGSGMYPANVKPGDAI